MYRFIRLAEWRIVRWPKSPHVLCHYSKHRFKTRQTAVEAECSAKTKNSNRRRQEQWEKNRESLLIRLSIIASEMKQIKTSLVHSDMMSFKTLSPSKFEQIVFWILYREKILYQATVPPIEKKLIFVKDVLQLLATKETDSITTGKPYITGTFSKKALTIHKWQR